MDDKYRFDIWGCILKMGIFDKFHQKPKPRKMTQTDKERHALKRQESQGKAISDKAFDDYFAGKITKSEFDKRVNRATRVARGFD